MIKLIKASKKYKDKTLFNDVYINIKKAGIYSFIGENGSGKTTLLNIVLGFIKLSKGKVVNKTRSYSFVMQNICLIDHLTIYDHFNMCNLDINLLKRIKLFNKRNEYPHKLSRGQKQRIFSILAIYSPSCLLVMDEPTSNLDDKNVLLVMKEIKKVSKQKIVLLVSHDKNLIEKYSDQIYKIENNKIELIYDSAKEKELEKGKKNKFKFNKYIKKSIFFYKRINLLFMLIFFIVFFLLLFSFNLKNNLNKQINNSVNNSLDYNKFYLKQCENKGYVKKCYNLNEEKIEIIKNSKHQIGYNYDLLLNSLYDSDKFSVINKEKYVLKEGKYPMKYNEIITNDNYKIGDTISLKTSKVLTKDKTDIYVNDIVLKVVGIIEQNMFYRNNNYYLNYDLIDSYFKNEYLINNKISLYDYFVSSELNDYKYIMYFKSVDISFLKENNIEYVSASYDYYKSFSNMIKEIDKCLFYLNVILVFACSYYMIRLLMKKIKCKDNEIICLKSMGVSKNKIINLIYKEQAYLILCSFFFNVLIILVILKLIFNKVYFGFLYSFFILFAVLFANKKIIKLIVNKRGRI